MLKLLTALLLLPLLAAAMPSTPCCLQLPSLQDSLILPGKTTAPGKALNKRQYFVLASTTASLGASLRLLDKAWYNQFSKSRFHFFNDGKEWLQMDKAGHAWTAYHLSRANAALWTWAGAKRQQALWISCATTTLYTTAIEWLDGHSAKWGWSWADIGANSAGSFLYASQQALWQKQKLSLKISVMPNRYASDLRGRANQLFGKSTPERILKDYNSQTYWLSLNLKSINKSGSLPPWLNVAFGYGAHHMWGGFANKVYSEKGELLFDRSDIRRHRQWYLSPDIDLSSIKTSSRLLRTVLTTLDCIKLPLPALMLDGGRLKFTALP